MGIKSFFKKNENRLLALGFVLFLFIFVAVRYDFYYALNDDVAMKDILSGAYTGSPESWNVQMLYPLSLLISLLYRVAGRLPVYGIFLCICQFGCLYLIMERSLGFFKSVRTKILAAALEVTVMTVLYLEHLVFVQYTVVSALLAGTAAFLFLTMETAGTTREFIGRNRLNILLVILAFCLRTEMLLLVLPLLCVAGVCQWEKDRPFFSGENLRKYLGVSGLILGGMLTVYAANEAAYSGRAWKEFMGFFDSRTQLYDYQGIPDYEENMKFYERIGMTANEQEMLLEQYNFGLDDTVDKRTLDAVTVYQEKVKGTDESFTGKLGEAFKEYRYRTFHKEMKESAKEDDYPFNAMVILVYICVFIAGIWNAAAQEKKMLTGAYRIGWKLLLLAFVRTALWMFILMRGRTPARITHPLYLTELCILFGILHVECAGIAAGTYGRFKAMAVFPAVIAVTAAAALSPAIQEADQEYAAREEANQTYRAVQDYCRSHKDLFYFIDVYSFVSDPRTGIPYSEKLLADTDNEIANYDIMGGWLVKSPLYEKKLSAFGLDSMGTSLAGNEKVYFMAELTKGTEALTGYYSDQDKIIETQLVDTMNHVIGVYAVTGD